MEGGGGGGSDGGEAVAAGAGIADKPPGEEQLNHNDTRNGKEGGGVLTSDAVAKVNGASMGANTTGVSPFANGRTGEVELEVDGEENVGEEGEAVKRSRGAAGRKSYVTHVAINLLPGICG